MGHFEGKFSKDLAGVEGKTRENKEKKNDKMKNGIPSENWKLAKNVEF